MAKSAAEDFLDNFDDSCFPVDFLLSYEVLECLGQNEMGETLLVRDLQTDLYHIAKCYEKNGPFGHTRESDILKGLHHKGLPGFIAEFENDAMLCVVREFMEGSTLDQLSQNLRFTREQTISIGVQLCEILNYLHDHTPPIIHRDIKPQNVIMDKEGGIRLIDFGISHFYNKKKQNDTVCLGTMEFAPPEQYGFSQTDCRADIFSLGVLLCWLITGETDTKKVIYRIKDRQLRHIIKKCVAFAPEKRYSSANKVRTSLIRAKRRTYQAALRWMCLLLLCIIFLFAGFSIGRYTDITVTFFTEAGVNFEEPLIEKAVRIALNKQEEDLINEEDLQKVTELYICGNKAAKSQEEFDELCNQMVQNNGSIYNGKIRSLKDIAKLENLRKLNIVLQNITDLSPLADLYQLERIELKHNPIENLAPLKELSSLRELYLYDTYITDLSVLSGCPRLENLVVGRTNITSINAFEGIKRLTCLHAEQIAFETLSGIENHPYLQEIGLTSIADEDLTQLLSLPQLNKVYLSEAMREAAQKITDSAKFEIIYQE